jgi:hypothetical protein
MPGHFSARLSVATITPRAVTLRQAEARTLTHKIIHRVIGKTLPELFVFKTLLFLVHVSV